MSDDTRDIAIQTRADVKHISDELASIKTTMLELKADLSERKGAEKVARLIIGLGGGAAGAALTKFGAVLFNAPYPR